MNSDHYIPLLKMTKEREKELRKKWQCTGTDQDELLMGIDGLQIENEILHCRVKKLENNLIQSEQALSESRVEVVKLTNRAINLIIEFRELIRFSYERSQQ